MPQAAITVVIRIIDDNIKTEYGQKLQCRKQQSQ